MSVRWWGCEPVDKPKLKLSEAIRLGSMMKPQGHGMMLSPDGGSCAGGAALDAIGKLTEKSLIVDLCWWFPVAMQRVAPPSVSLLAADAEPDNSLCLASWITFLNDGLHWSREKIADFVETVEKRVEELEIEARRLERAEMIKSLRQEGRQDKVETQEEAPVCA